MKILVTGGLGFIGSAFIRFMLHKYDNYSVVNLDKMTYAANPDNLSMVENDSRYSFIKGDITNKDLVDELVKEQEFDAIINFAAESHVDRSIENPGAFIQTDVFGTYVLLEAVKQFKVPRYVQVSTDEVYGDYEEGFAKETDPLHPSSPYSASKAGGDMQVIAYQRTFDVPALITRCTNNYGSHQYPEKIIPLFITNIIEGKKIPMYGDGGQIRDWLYVDDHCSAIDLVLHEGVVGEVYNVGANQNPEITNLDLTKKILEIMGESEDMIEYVEDRPGHDRRYAVDASKIKALGWDKAVRFEEGLEKTIAWYQDNQDWWKKIKTGEFLEFYKKQYKDQV